MMTALTLFGGASLEDESGVITGPAAQRHRLALLALLASAPSRSRSRDTLMALLWPERVRERARKLLNQSVYVLRGTLGESTLLSVGGELRLDTARLRCDVVAFEEALEAGDLERAAGLYTGPFLEGFHLEGSVEFERWLEGERRRLADACAEAVEALARAAEERGAPTEAVEWWKHRAASDPYDSRVAFRLGQALVAAGNPAGALRHAALHARRLREHLGVEPPDELIAFVEQLRVASGPERPPDGVERAAVDASRGGATAEVGPARPPTLDPRRAPGGDAGGARSHRHVVYGAAVLLLAAVIVAVVRVGLRSPARYPVAEGTAEDGDEPARVASREGERSIGTDPGARRPEHRTHSIAALELYERGSDPALLRSSQGVRRGADYFRRAIALDSTYAAAWAALAWMTVRRTSDVAPGAPRRELYERAEVAARRAIALDDSLAEAHAALGFLRMVAGFDFAAAERHLRRAIALDPSQARFREWLVGPYLWTGRGDDALAEARRALAIDSVSPTAHAELARVLAARGHCADALARLDRLEGLEPPLLRAAAIEASCRTEDTAWLRRQAGRTRDEWTLGVLGHLLGRAGARGTALRIREGLLAREGNRTVGAFPVAMVDAGLGDHEGAFAGFERALDDLTLMGSPDHFTMLAAVRAVADDDPRFRELSARIGLVWPPERPD